MQKTKSRYTVIKIVAIVFSLIGGVHNLSGSFVELILPNFGPAQGSTGSFSNVFVGLLAIIFASATVIAAFYIMRKPRVAGLSLIHI